MNKVLFHWSLGIAGFLLVSAVTMLGWVCKQMWEIHPNVVETSKRVDRIVQQIPEIRARIVHEDLDTFFKEALFATKPIQSADEMVVLVHQILLETGKRRTYKIRLSDKSDTKNVCTLLGTYYYSEPIPDNILTLSHVVADAHAVGIRLPVPHYLDERASLIGHSFGNSLSEEVSKVLGEYHEYDFPIKRAAKIRDLLIEFDKNSSAYQTVDHL